MGGGARHLAEALGSRSVFRLYLDEECTPGAVLVRTESRGGVGGGARHLAEALGSRSVFRLYLDEECTPGAVLVRTESREWVGAPDT